MQVVFILNTFLFKTMMLRESLNFIILFFLTLVPVLFAVAYVILAERKVMASIQRRRGPNVVGFYGLLQPFIDAVKLIVKEPIIPRKVNAVLFVAGPVLTLSIAIVGWSFIPFGETNYYFNFTHSGLWVLTFSSIGVFGIALSGWASNSRYAFFGAVRAVSQFISYELILLLSLLPIFSLTGSLNLIDVVRWQVDSSMWFIVPLWPFAYTAFIAGLAETNRTPFDLPEAEAELVAGYSVEYSSIFFILFMFAEYSNLLLMSALFSIFFLGGWYCPLLPAAFVFDEAILGLKIALVATAFIVVRATQPRLRFDQLLRICWFEIFPLLMGFVVFIISCLLVREMYAASAFAELPLTVHVFNAVVAWLQQPVTCTGLYGYAQTWLTNC